MASFTYKARDSKGEAIQGAMEAESRAMVINRLQSMGYFPILIKGDESAKKGTGGFGDLFGRHVSINDLTSLNRQMADLLSAGIPLVKALTIISNQTPNHYLKEIVLQISSDVQGGDTFATALSRHPKVFSKLYCAMIRAGETGGMLDVILERLADFSETEEEVRGKIKSAMAYPVIMILASIGAIIILMTVVIPRILNVFEDLSQTLPVPTQILIGIMNLAGKYGLFVIGGLVFGGLILYKFLTTVEGRFLYHGILLQLPLLGPVFKKHQVARFARIFGSLLKNGVSILSALEITTEVVGNAVVQKEISRISENITQGSGVAAPIKGSSVFPPVVVNMIAIGEETGRLPDVLLRIAGSYEVEVDRSVKTLTSLIEPLIILIMGVLVGFIVISMLLPIFTLDPTQGGGF